MHIFLSGNWPLVEAEGYFAEEVLPRAEDPLAWLKANEKRFHLLSHLAKKYLCIPGASVPSERLFSKAGEVISNRQSRLKAKNVDMMFLNRNM